MVGVFFFFDQRLFSSGDNDEGFGGCAFAARFESSRAFILDESRAMN